MTWKDTVNEALQRLTSYHLTHETREQRAQAIRVASRAAAERARRKTARKHRAKAAQREVRHRRQLANQLANQKARLEESFQGRLEAEAAQRQRCAEERAGQRQQKRAARRARGEDLPTFLDDDARRIIVRVREHTMTGPPRLEALIEATRYVVRQQVPGDIVECGVWRGGSMQAVALTLLAMAETSRELHLFDTFEGMPAPTEEDTRTLRGETRTAEQLLAESDKESSMWAIAGLDDVEQGMAETGYPADKIHYHPGLVEDTTPDQAPGQIAILRLDTDWYASTKHELEVLYDRLSPGGLLIIDDYSDWDGARKAVDEWLEETTEPLFLMPMNGGRIAVKPFSSVV